MLKQESHFMRFGWRERYESRGSRTVLRGAGVKFPGLLTFKDLVVDQRPLWKAIRATMPWLVRENDLPDERIFYETWLKIQ